MEVRQSIVLRFKVYINFVRLVRVLRRRQTECHPPLPPVVVGPGIAEGYAEVYNFIPNPSSKSNRIPKRLSRSINSRPGADASINASRHKLPLIIVTVMKVQTSSLLYLFFMVRYFFSCITPTISLTMNRPLPTAFFNSRSLSSVSLSPL